MTGFQMLSSHIWPVAPILGSTLIHWVTLRMGALSYSFLTVAWQSAQNTRNTVHIRELNRMDALESDRAR